uniref:Uncharacterized protein n=1 Tax=Aegilops tauschii subsp. strangulata TaxID=200361 RepID=A0A453C9F8_AEGTS
WRTYTRRPSPLTRSARGAHSPMRAPRTSPFFAHARYRCGPSWCCNNLTPLTFFGILQHRSASTSTFGPPSPSPYYGNCGTPGTLVSFATNNTRP